MRPDTDVRKAFHLAAEGRSRAEIARRLGISRATVRDWLDHGEEVVLARPRRTASRGREAHRAERGKNCAYRNDLDEPAYSYLLGQYLGDGCISMIRNSPRLRIVCCDDYPNIMDECAAAIEAVHTSASVRFVHLTGCTEVFSTWAHWPCLFPQHGPGRKHERPIVLEPWQRQVAVERHPDRLIRGLIHSDGCRHINNVRGANGQPYSYIRYNFTNRSDDIRQLFVEACERLEIQSRRMNRWNISVARRDSVAKLDQIVGPKS